MSDLRLIAAEELKFIVGLESAHRFERKWS